jgi:hypothetical protein
VRGLVLGIVAMTVGASLVGCAHDRRTYLADGRPGYGVSCRHFYQDWSSCVLRAGQLCRNQGYTVAYSDEIDRELIVGCKKPELDHP